MIACDDYAPAHPERGCRIEEALLAGDCLIAEQRLQAAGYALVRHDFFGFEFVEVLMVHPALRRLGVGLALLQACIEQCQTAQLLTSANASNESAERLFIRAGFQPCGWIDGLTPGDAEIVYRVECGAANIRSAG